MAAGKQPLFNQASRESKSSVCAEPRIPDSVEIHLLGGIANSTVCLSRCEVSRFRTCMPAGDSVSCVHKPGQLKGPRGELNSAGSFQFCSARVRHGRWGRRIQRSGRTHWVGTGGRTEELVFGGDAAANSMAVV